MLWEVFWPLALGLLLSAIFPTVVSRRTVERALGSDSPRSLALATLFGAASSSCSYAAVAMARSLFCPGASFQARVRNTLLRHKRDQRPGIGELPGQHAAVDRERALRRIVGCVQWRVLCKT